ncbi:hypothetical protein C8R43DRAFT_950687 [Mycena crocata]|nr:hypothetical protein C8R43DRAFT_950687 [Mycena crocata]
MSTFDTLPLKSEPLPDTTLSARAAAQARYRAKNADAERDKARVRMRRLREERRKSAGHSTDPVVSHGEEAHAIHEPSGIPETIRNLSQEELWASHDFREFAEYCDKVKIVTLTFDATDPERAEEFKRFMATNPCVEDLPAHDNEEVEWRYFLQLEHDRYPEWKEELADYRDIIAEMTPEELDKNTMRRLNGRDVAPGARNFKLSERLDTNTAARYSVLWTEETAHASAASATEIRISWLRVGAVDTVPPVVRVFQEGTHRLTDCGGGGGSSEVRIGVNSIAQKEYGMRAGLTNVRDETDLVVKVHTPKDATNFSKSHQNCGVGFCRAGNGAQKLIFAVRTITTILPAKQTLTMTRTNLPLEDMIPDTKNPAHDPRYWCLPPVREQQSRSNGSGKFPMYLVTQGKIVGFGDLVKTLVDGYPSGSQRGHRTMEGCVEEWQVLCALGCHPHAIDPALSSTHSASVPLLADSSPPPSPSPSPPPRSSSPAPDSSPMSSPPSSPSSSDALSSLGQESSVTSSWDQVPENKHYFARWGAGVVYSDRGQAKRDFLAAQARGGKHKILSTGLYDEAQAFAEGVHWIGD